MSLSLALHTPKTIPKKNFGPKSFPSIPASIWYFFVTSQVFLKKKKCTIFTETQNKSIQNLTKRGARCMWMVSSCIHTTLCQHEMLSWRFFAKPRHDSKTLFSLFSLYLPFKGLFHYFGAKTLTPVLWGLFVYFFVCLEVIIAISLNLRINIANI